MPCEVALFHNICEDRTQSSDTTGYIDSLWSRLFCLVYSGTHSWHRSHKDGQNQHINIVRAHLCLASLRSCSVQVESVISTWKATVSPTSTPSHALPTVCEKLVNARTGQCIGGRGIVILLILFTCHNQEWRLHPPQKLCLVVIPPSVQ